MTDGQARDSVVVGCDGSWYGNRAVAAAAREADTRDARLVVLVAVRDGRFDDVSLGSARAAREEVRGRAQATATRAVEQARQVSPDVAVDVVIAEPGGPEVRELTRRAAILVVGARGRGGQGVFSLGSLSDELVRGFPVPILVPGPEATAAHPVTRQPLVVVGVDGLGFEEELLAIAAAQAKVRKCGLVIVRAVPPGSGDGGLSQPEVWDDTWMAVRHAERSAEVPCRVVVSQQPPVAALLGECAPGDLLVVGTRGEGRLAGLISGSVARGVLDAGSCDVLVVTPWARKGHVRDRQPA